MVRNDTGVLRVATLNVWARNGDWPARREVLARGFAELDADLVALQETIVTDEVDQVRDIFGANYHVAHQRNGRADGLGISIASRWPIGAVQELDLHVTERTTVQFPCAMIAAEIETPDPVGTVIFANHFPNPALDVEYERELQAVISARALEHLAFGKERQVIVAGDLDADPASASVRFWTGRQSLGGTSVCYRDAWESTHPDVPGHTFTPERGIVKDQVFRGVKAFADWPFRRIDYIFVRFGSHCGAALQIKSCSNIFDQPIDGISASDHFGVVADLAPPP